ncbi:MAG: trypsin-like peptidase domain-containing protein [Chloroflexota bacterium]
MTDRPRFDVDDTTSSYSPPPSTRPRWVDQGWGAAAPGSAPTAQKAPVNPGNPGTPPAGTPHWYDPTWQSASAAPVGGGPSQPVPAAPPSASAPRPPRRAGVGMGGLVAVALVAGISGAVITVGVLGAGGYLGMREPDQGSITPTRTSATATRVVTVEQSDITAAVKRVSPAVVTITSRAANGDLVAADPLELPATGVGSGILFDDQSGLILTARHVVCGADQLTVKLVDGREFGATTYGVDTLTDLAIVKLDGDPKNLPVAGVGDSSSLEPGQVAIAIGSPMGTYTNSVTTGVVSATHRDVNIAERCGDGGERVLRNLIQTDAAINPGNSGGPLIDSSGRVIGVSTAMSGDAQGIGFAIPINIAKPIMDQAVAGKDLERPWIGVYYEPVTPALVSQLDLPIDYGILVRSSASDPAVVDGSPAAVAGVQEGDLVTTINGERIDYEHPMDDLLAQYGPDEKLNLSILRGGQTLTLQVTLGRRPAQL